ncbi:MAG: DUF1330 domain-containing protein [Acidobacteriota bacterium]
MSSQTPSQSAPSPGGPIYMLNALWFEPDGGAALYAEYARRVSPLLEARGARVLDRVYAPDLVLEAEGVEPFEPDLCFLVEWPSWEVFLSMVHDPAYAECKALRERATAKRLLVRCRSLAAITGAAER